MDGKVGSSGHSPVRQGQPDANARPGQRNSVANRLGPRVAEAAHHQAETKNSPSSAADVAPLAATESTRHVSGVDLRLRRLEGEHYICTTEQPNPALNSYFRGWVDGKRTYAIPPSELTRSEDLGCVLS